MKNNTSVTAVSPSQLREAATMQEQIETISGKVSTLDAEFHAQRETLTKELGSLTSQYNAIFGIVSGEKSGSGTGRKFSAEIRAKISAGQKAKWAERKALAAAASVAPVAPVAETPVMPVN